MDVWREAQKWESNWWGNCINTYYEETKQIVYAKKMGLISHNILGKYPVYDLHNASVLDIGGGSCSILLKCNNLEQGIVVDPCEYPEWIYQRYKSAGIEFFNIMGEEINFDRIFDEVWIYNVLQHCKNPKKIIDNAKKLGKIVRIFEWIEIPLSDGHIHVLHQNELDGWLGGEGKIEDLNDDGCYGLSYYGIFKGKHYEEI